MVVLPTSPTSSVPGGDTCVTGACLERRLSLRTYKLSKLLVFPRIQSGGDVRNTGACLEQNTSRWWCFQPSKLSRAWKIVWNGEYLGGSDHAKHFTWRRHMHCWSLSGKQPVYTMMFFPNTQTFQAGSTSDVTESCLVWKLFRRWWSFQTHRLSKSTVFRGGSDLEETRASPIPAWNDACRRCPTRSRRRSPVSDRAPAVSCLRAMCWVAPHWPPPPCSPTWQPPPLSPPRRWPSTALWCWVVRELEKRRWRSSSSRPNTSQRRTRASVSGCRGYCVLLAEISWLHIWIPNPASGHRTHSYRCITVRLTSVVIWIHHKPVWL